MRAKRITSKDYIKRLELKAKKEAHDQAMINLSKAIFGMVEGDGMDEGVPEVLELLNELDGFVQNHIDEGHSSEDICSILREMTAYYISQTDVMFQKGGK